MALYHFKLKALCDWPLQVMLKKLTILQVELKFLRRQVENYEKDSNSRTNKIQLTHTKEKIEEISQELEKLQVQR